MTGLVAAQPRTSTTPAPGRSQLRRWTTLVQAAAGGLATEAAFPDRSWWPMAALGVALLVLALRRDDARWAGLVGVVWGLAFFAPHLWWARAAAGTIPWLALAVVQSTLVTVGAMAWVIARRARWLRRAPLTALTFTVIWVADEQLRSTWPFGGFPWGRLAFSQTDGPLLPLAWLGGAPLVSATVAFAGFLVAAVWSALRQGRRRQAAAAAVLVAAMPVLATTIPLSTAAQSGTLRLAAVQGDVPDQDALLVDRARAVLDNHVAGTLALLEDADRGEYDVVVWPENATDIDPRADGEAAAAAVERASAAAGAPILLGTDRRVPDGRYVQMLLWEPGRGPVFAYSKQRVVPFGEYIPARGLVRLFSREVDRVRTDALPGAEPAVVPVTVPRLGRTVQLATPICFEVAFDDVVRTAVRDGAELLVVPTNNASFGWTTESTQQLAMTRLRAVEHGRAAIQISTVGVSAIVGPDGTVQQRTGLFTADTLRAELPLRTSLTPADRLGDAPTTTAVALAVAALLAGIVATRTRRPARTARRHQPAQGTSGPPAVAASLQDPSTQPTHPRRRHA
jgi:apolipoprotein N-acyltransferase